MKHHFGPVDLNKVYTKDIAKTSNHVQSGENPLNLSQQILFILRVLLYPEKPLGVQKTRIRLGNTR